jgi:hypothetical protein
VSARSEHRLFRLAEILRTPDLLKRPEPLVAFTAWLGRVVLLAGREKYAGKSTLVTAGAAAVTRGSDFLGHRCQRGDVLWVSADQEHPGDVALRCMRFDADPRRLHILYPGFAPLDARLTEIEAEAAKIKPLRWIVLDTLSNLARVKDPYSSTEWPEALLRLKELARTGNIAVTALHHTTKHDEEEYRDSTAIGATVDQITVLVSNEHDRAAPQRELKSYGRLGNAAVTVELDDAQYRVAASAGTQLEQRILAHVRATPGHSRNAIAKALRGRHNKAMAAIKRLVEVGQLVERAHGIHVGNGRGPTNEITIVAADYGRALAEQHIAAWARHAPRSRA